MHMDTIKLFIHVKNMRSRDNSLFLVMKIEKNSSETDRKSTRATKRLSEGTQFAATAKWPMKTTTATTTTTTTATMNVIKQ